MKLLGFSLLVPAFATLLAGATAGSVLTCDRQAASGQREVAQRCVSGYCCGQWGCWTSCRCW